MVVHTTGVTEIIEVECEEKNKQTWEYYVCAHACARVWREAIEEINMNMIDEAGREVIKDPL